MSIRTKLSLALGVLLLFNATYFYVGARSIGEMNVLARNLYDRVVMSSTYAQMVKNDFQRWTALKTALVIATEENERTRLPAELDEAASAFRDDLAVVRERAMSAENKAAVDEIGTEFERLGHVADVAVSRARGDAGVLARAREWARSGDSQKLLGQITDLTDRIVADGYQYRLSSEERSAAIKRTSVVLSIAVLILNVLCLGFVLSSILPRLRKLTLICAEIAAGNFKRRVTIGTDDELGRLGVAFNVMLEALRESEEKIEAQLITTNALMNGLGQGFFMIGPDQVCLSVYSKACLDLLEGAPDGRKAHEVFRVPEHERASFADWLDVLVSDVGTFDDLASLGPALFPHSAGRTVTLEYKPLRDAAGTLRAIVVVATDRTAEVRARGDAEREQETARLVTKLLRHRSDFVRFFERAPSLIDEVLDADVSVGLRGLHTLKGAAAMLSLEKIRDLAHRSESDLIEARRSSLLSADVREGVRERLGEELARTKAWLDADFGFGADVAADSGEGMTAALRDFHAALANSPGQTALADAFARQFLMEPAVELLRPLASIARDLASQLGKSVDVVLSADGIELRRDDVDDVVSVLGHVVRNAIDHGIEAPAERTERKKPSTATLRIEVVRPNDGWLRFQLSDDGRGLDVKRLRERSAERGIDLTAETDDAVMQRVFDAGLSTADVVTEISGRGVGLDAVKAAVTSRGGRVWVESARGQGTTFTIEIPERSPFIVRNVA